MKNGQLFPSFTALLVAGLVVFGRGTLAQVTEFCYGPDCPLPPQHWADEFSSCGGDQQSPIDISHTDRARQGLAQLRFRYTKTELVVENTGHTVEVKYEDDGRNTLRVGGLQCRLLQFHFHTRSEHTVGGVSFPVEAHLVHSCPTGRLLVVGVLMQHFNGEDNPVLQAALDSAPFDDLLDDYIEGEAHVPGVRVNAQGLLPKNRSYFTYDGSLTTPGCSEIVDWYVLNEPVRVSEGQVQQLRQLTEDTSPDNYPENNRPVQELGARKILSKGPVGHHDHDQPGNHGRWFVPLVN